ncbi:MAG: T9SS type A sorting domain-containing protein [Chitinophagales bacterium]|nr:T9SS type A sorting domain-containing protein [Chitinophagales bacterium]MDW8428825.1 T9SS type A sorting domain-containing protein [Chitinophagales bacterium]
MKALNSRLSDMLSKYSALALPVVGVVSEAEGQIIYTDLDPDIVLGVGQDYALDLNNDGNVDFKFKVATYGTGWYVAGLLPYPPYTTNLNAFAGYTMTFGGDPSIYPFASVFNAGDVIDAARPWVGMNEMIWTSNGAPYYFYAAMVSNFYGYIYGQWSGAVDKFLGIRFSPNGNQVHYGWIRCDVDSNGSQLTIKDMAFEATPEKPIVAGDLVGVAEQTTAPFGIVNMDGLVTIYARHHTPEHATLQVTNAVGQVLWRQKLTEQVSRIDLRQMPKGLYVIQLNDDSQQTVKKVVIR